MNKPDNKTEGFKNLEDLKAYKTELKKEVDLQQEKLTRSFEHLVSPVVNASPLTFLITNMTKGFSIMESIILGVRTARRILKIFRK